MMIPKNKFKDLSEHEESVGRIIIDCGFNLHKSLGPGLLESVYEKCLEHELNKQGLVCQRQAKVPLIYDGLEFEEAFRLDLLVEDLVICEIKAADEVHPVHKAQILSYLRLTGKRLGYLINFNTELYKQGIKRFVLTNHEQ